ncbi:MAG: GH116 family glycosyl hydrolase [Candidatus Acidiferrales bacterium]
MDRRGDSAHCGSLYLAALRASEEMARQLHHSASAQKHHASFVRGQKTFISKLWNGEYFRYDDESQSSNTIMADQLAGQWYADLIGLGDIVPRTMRLPALHKIYDFNVMKFGDSDMGAVNGVDPDGKPPNANEQAHEVWTGSTFGLASFLFAEGMQKEAFQTARGIYHVVYEKEGYWFRTPEAWDITGSFRASMYMRPGAIWALEMMQPPRASK